MPLKYETVDTMTLKGLKRAEYLHTHGWKTIRNGLFTIQFEKKILSSWAKKRQLINKTEGTEKC